MISMAHTPLYWLQYVIISKNLQLFVAEPCQNATQQLKVPISFSSMALILYMNNLTTIITETKKEAIWADTGITNLCHCMAMSEIKNTVFWWALQQLCNLHLGAFNTDGVLSCHKVQQIMWCKKILLHWTQETNWREKIIYLLHYALLSGNNPKLPLRTVQRLYQSFSEHSSLHHLAVKSHCGCNHCYIWNYCKHPGNKSKNTPSSSARKLLRR